MGKPIGLNKKEIAHRIYNSSAVGKDLQLKEVELIVERVFMEMQIELIKGERVFIDKFFSMKPYLSPARITGLRGKSVKVEEKTMVKTKVSRVFKERLNKF